MSSPRIALVAIPLMARSGVYRSAHDLVRSATSQGMNWSAVLGMRPAAPGSAMRTDAVREFEFDIRGRAGLKAIAKMIDDAPEVALADVVITLISQSDIAMVKTRSREHTAWVAWVRGKPWPARGEQSMLRRALLRVVESRALRAADEVWATTPVLAKEFASARRAEVVPAGIAGVQRISYGRGNGPLVWAGRVDVDKRPELFAQIVEQTGHTGRIFGEGPLFSKLSGRPTAGLIWEGWSDATTLWTDASIFVGTSAREAFGRSAVEAAAAGLPVVIGAEYGAAPLLFTNASLRSECVVASPDPAVWANAVRRLLDDVELRTAVSEHVHENAQRLTIRNSVLAASRRAQRILAPIRPE